MDQNKIYIILIIILTVLIYISYSTYSTYKPNPKIVYRLLNEIYFLKEEYILFLFCFKKFWYRLVDFRITGCTGKEAFVN